MFNFKSKKQPAVAVQTTTKSQEVVAEPQKTNEQIIQEIHDTFYSEVDRLLAEAKVSLSEDSTQEELIKKAERLKALGFGDTKECRDAQAEIIRLSNVRQINVGKQQLTAAINYFSQKYPQYKFITEESVKKICEKYGLIYGNVGDYIGSVPEKNLQQIENFKINENDECYFSESLKESRQRISSGFGGSLFWPSFETVTNPHSFDEYMKGKLEHEKYFSEPQNYQQIRSQLRSDLDIFSNLLAMQNAAQQQQSVIPTPYYNRIKKCPLEIAAPPSDFNTKNKEIKDFKLVEIPDPVVLKPVFFEEKKHYLIVTAWGLEASDELVVNQKMN